jgi:hypothetical protein
MCEFMGMRKGIEVRLGPGDRERLAAVIGSGNSPQKHVWRARIVLLSGDGLGTMAIQRQTGKGKPTIWRWQARFMAEGVDGLLHDATRPGRKKPLPAATVERVVEMTLAGPPGETTHWPLIRRRLASDFLRLPRSVFHDAHYRVDLGPHLHAPFMIPTMPLPLRRAPPLWLPRRSQQCPWR